MTRTSEGFLATQARVVLSEPVLSRALKHIDDDVSLAVNPRIPDRISWLQSSGALQVEGANKADLITVSMDANDAYEAAAYANALSRDPDVFERTSKNGVAAQMARPEDRAHYDYVVAKIYAKMGVADRSLEYLRKALEEGYKGINSVYKDSEFSGVRKDPRFNQLMASRIPAIAD